MAERFLRIAEVCRVTGLSATTIWRLEQTGGFPKRYRLGRGSVGWRLSELNDWLETRPKADPEEPT